MNTNQIDCFLEAARHSSFSAAAAVLYLSPQAVSKQVISLEAELNARLFNRNGPRLRLTEIGAMYRRLFEGQIRQFDYLKDDIRLHRKSLSMTLRIGVSEWIDPFGEFGVGFRRFFEKNRQRSFSLYCYSNNELLDALLNGSVDCGFFSGAQQPDRRDMEVTAVTSESIVQFAPADLGSGPMREDCWGLPLFMTLAWNWIRTEYRLLGFRERLVANLHPSELIMLPNYQSLLSEMVHNRGVTLAGSRFTPFCRIPSLTGHDTGITDDIVCLWRKSNENPLLPELAGFLQDHFR